jgi:hypothetical protein
MVILELYLKIEINTIKIIMLHEIQN